MNLFKKSLQSDTAGDEKMLQLIFQSFFFGIYFFYLFLVNANGIINERGEWQIYIFGWLVVPAASLAAVWAVEVVQERFFQKNIFFYPVFLVSSAIYFLVAVWSIRLSHPLFAHCPTFFHVLQLLSLQAPSFETGQFVSSFIPKGVLTTIAWFYPFYILFVFFLVRAVKWLIKAEKGERVIVQACYGVLPLIAGAGLINYAGITLDNYKLALAALVLGFAFLGHKRIIDFKFPTHWAKPLNIALVVLLAYLIFDPTFSINHPHQNPVLAPVNDMMLGKSLLVDTNCQYGVFLIYFLRAFFALVPISYQGLTLVSVILFFVQYAAIYFLLRFITKSQFFSLMAMFLIILANYFATLGGEIAAYPSLGPLRFCLSYLLLFVVMRRIKRPADQKLYRNIERCIIALASIWSFEAFFYTMAMYTAVLLFEALTESKNITDGILTILERTGIIFVFAAGAHFLLYWSIYLYSGQFPQWDHYLDYIFLYSTGGWGAMPIAPWSPWIFFAIVPFLILVALVYHARAGQLKNNPALKITAALVFLCIAQFTYFVGRSHPNNLFHVSVTVLMLAVYGLSILGQKPRQATRWFYSVLLYCCYFALFYFILSLMPRMIDKLALRLPQYAHISANYTKSPTHPETAGALVLVDKYFKDKKHIGLFIEEDAMTEVLMLSRKLHVMPLNYPRQEDICPTARERVFDAVPFFKEGDIIIIAQDCGGFQESILNRMQSRFKFNTIEAAPPFFVIQLGR